ncbi:AmiS/UreI family transporter [Arthrobacter sp. ISL-69]|uniref:AmiS/UreI family transporter n=1 Tax=Arthrobacter sp. ISL-69 TaxID=2819113 RepID=UPI001BE6A9C4|nr:AmiS/UreI family transporter [Arthrobacter sp. ISL-69]MBT2534641.1 AmiS/UreI transporter [Arthrobacter sp. ISL-69]
MAHICLLLSGAALLLNGLAALDLLPRRDAAVFSLVIGGTQLVLGVTYLGITGDGGLHLLLGASGMFLFGLTYVYVGLDFLLGLGSRGLGWFCGMVGLCGLLLAAAWSGEDPLLAVLWLCWTYLWLLFYLQLALGMERLTPLIGWSLVLTSQASATVPAFMGLTGRWPGEPEIAAGAAVSLLALLLLAGGLAWRGRHQTAARPAVAAVAVAVESPLPGELKV